MQPNFLATSSVVSMFFIVAPFLTESYSETSAFLVGKSYFAQNGNLSVLHLAILIGMGNIYSRRATNAKHGETNMKIEWSTWSGIETAMVYSLGGYNGGWKIISSDGHESYAPNLPSGYREVK